MSTTFTVVLDGPATLTAPRLEMILGIALPEYAGIDNPVTVWRHDDEHYPAETPSPAHTTAVTPGNDVTTCEHTNTRDDHDGTLICVDCWRWLSPVDGQWHAWF